MHHRSRGQTRFGVVVVAAALFLVGCGDEVAGPGGPCLDAAYEVVGDIDLTVSAGSQNTTAAFGWMRANPCPGANSAGPLEADGFFHTLDESLINLEPGREVAVAGPGFRDADLATDWPIVAKRTLASGGTEWTLRAPQGHGRYEVLFSLRWAQGEAAYKALIDVGVDVPSSEG